MRSSCTSYVMHKQKTHQPELWQCPKQAGHTQGIEGQSWHRHDVLIHAFALPLALELCSRRVLQGPPTGAAQRLLIFRLDPSFSTSVVITKLWYFFLEDTISARRNSRRLIFLPLIVLNKSSAFVIIGSIIRQKKTQKLSKSKVESITSGFLAMHNRYKHNNASMKIVKLSVKNIPRIIEMYGHRWPYMKCDTATGGRI